MEREKLLKSRPLYFPNQFLHSAASLLSVSLSLPSSASFLL